MGDGQNHAGPQRWPGVRLIRLWANALVSPPVRSNSRIQTGCWRVLAGNYIDLRATCGSRTRTSRRPMTGFGWSRPNPVEDARQGQRLQGADPASRRNTFTKRLPHRPMAQAAATRSRVFYIDKGAGDGLDRDMAVITPDGIVGKVRDIISPLGAGIGDQRPIKRRGRDSGNNAHSRHPARKRRRPAADSWHSGGQSHSTRRESALLPGATRSSLGECRWARWRKLFATLSAMGSSTSSSSLPLISTALMRYL